MCIRDRYTVANMNVRSLSGQYNRPVQTTAYTDNVAIIRCSCKGNVCTEPANKYERGRIGNKIWITPE